MSSEHLKKEALGFVCQIEESLEIQMSSTKLLDYCVNDMLSLGQINNPGKFRKNCSNFNIEEAIKEIMEIQQAKADYQGIQLISSYTGFDEDLMICTDQYRLQQVVLNLQSNALKFTERNGHVNIHCKKTQDSIYIEVIDTGIGMK